MSELRENYESKETEELVDFLKNDLTPEALETLYSVLQARGLDKAELDKARLELKSNHEKSQNELASRTIRIVAFFVDFFAIGIILFILFLPLAFISGEELSKFWSGIQIFLMFVYMLCRDAIPGQGIGKRLFKIRVVQIDSGRPCSLGKSFIRNALHVFWFIDALFALGRRKMRLGDILAGTKVINRVT